MPIFEIETDQGVFEIEANREPTPEEALQAISEQRPKENIGDILQRNFGEALRGIHTEVLSPVASGLSTAAFGIPKAVAQKFGVKEAIFPEQETTQGKALRGIGELRGLFTGGASKVAKKAGELVPKVAGEGLRRIAGRGALQGGAFGATQLAEEPTLAGQAGRGAVGAAFGGLIGAGIEGAKNASKLGIDYFNKSVVPRANQMFTNAVESFSPSVQKFAQKTGKVSSQVTDYIAERTPQQIRSTLQKFGGSADDALSSIKQNIDDAFLAKNNQIEQLYADAFDAVDDNASIPINKAFQEARKVLEKNSFIDRFGNRLPISKAQSADQSLKALTDFYEFLAPTQGAATTAAQRVPGGVNKFVWRQFRDALSRASIKGGKSGTTQDIVNISDKLHDQASEFGVKGINVARREAAKFFKHSEILNRVKSESQLRGIFKVSDRSKALSQLDDYLGKEFTPQTKDVLAAQGLQRVDDLAVEQFGGGSKVINALKNAKDKTEFSAVKSQFQELLGESDDLTQLFKDIEIFSSAQKLRGTAEAIGKGALIFEGGRRFIFNPLFRAIEESGGGGGQQFQGGQ